MKTIKKKNQCEYEYLMNWILFFLFSVYFMCICCTNGTDVEFMSGIFVCLKVGFDFVHRLFTINYPLMCIIFLS